jgi:TetR/AcrR family transcriptional repressor of lmrAB and yxaGH operons
MPRRSDVRQKMIVSQALLQRERGVAGTALPDVLEHSGAPRGSIYHHFPEGRAQLAQEATSWAADFISHRLEKLLASGDVHEAVDAFVADWHAILDGSEFVAGCPVVAGALDGTTRDAAAAGFRRWEQLLTDALAASGAANAEALAVTIIASIEGAIVLSRAEGTSRPLERTADQLRFLLQQELAS